MTTSRASSNQKAYPKCHVHDMRVSLALAISLVITFDSLATQAAGQAVRTIVTTFDYSGPGGLAAAGIPSKITMKVKETNEILKIAEFHSTKQTNKPDEPLIGFNETHYSKGKPVCRSFIAVSALKRYRLLERREGFSTVYDYEESFGIALGLAKAADVVEDKMDSLVARYSASTDAESLQKPFLVVEERHFDRGGKVVFHARHKVAPASGRFVEEERVIGQRKTQYTQYICSWPTAHYGERTGPGMGGTVTSVEQKEMVETSTLAAEQKASSRGPEAFSTPLPAALRAAAKKAFAEGRVYFIWPERPGSIGPIPSGQSEVKIPFNYAVKPGAGTEPFATKLKLEATARSGTPRVAGSWTLPGDARGAVGDKTGQWKAVAVIKQTLLTYTGKGEATVFLIKKSEIDNRDAQPISNTATLEIVFE